MKGLLSGIVSGWSTNNQKVNAGKKQWEAVTLAPTFQCWDVNNGQQILPEALFTAQLNCL